jgi:hypothetical protein
LFFRDLQLSCDVFDCEERADAAFVDPKIGSDLKDLTMELRAQTLGERGVIGNRSPNGRIWDCG